MLNIFSAGTSLGSVNHGTEIAPEALLHGGLLTALTYNGIDYEVQAPIHDRPASTQRHRQLYNYQSVVDFNKSLYQKIITTSEPADRNLVLGGDHSIGIGSMFASKKLWPSTKLIYIDAHPDCHDKPADTTSGNIHGFPLSTVLGDGLYAEFDYPKYSYDEVVMVGLKDIDDDEQAYLDRHKISYFTIDRVIEQGIGAVMRGALDFLGDAPIHVGLDIDSIDVTEAPGTGIINKGGLSYREINYIVRQLAQRRVVATDLVEINPKRDSMRKTVDLGIELATILAGGKWSAYTKYLLNNDPQTK